MTYWKHKEKLLLLIAKLGECQETHPRGAVLPSTDTQRELTQSFFTLTACSEIISENNIERPSVV